MKTQMIAWMLLLLSTLGLPAQDKAPANLLKNPGFEASDIKNPHMPADWGAFAEKGEPSAFMLVTDNPKEGQKALKLAFEGGSGAKYYGITQRLPVKPGQLVTFACNLRNVSLRDDSYVQISIEWVGGEEQGRKEITRSWGPTAKALDVTTDAYKKIEITAAAPDGAAEMIVVVTIFPASGTDGAILVDDLNVVAKDAATKA